MNDRTKRLARLAIMTALGTVLLLLGSALPTGRLALIALSSLPVCVALLMAGAVLFMHRANIKRLLNGTESKTFHKK